MRKIIFLLIIGIALLIMIQNNVSIWYYIGALLFMLVVWKYYEM